MGTSRLDRIRISGAGKAHFPTHPYMAQVHFLVFKAKARIVSTS